MAIPRHQVRQYPRTIQAIDLKHDLRLQNKCNEIWVCLPFTKSSPSQQNSSLKFNTRAKCPQTFYPLRLEDGLIHLPAGVGSHSEDIFDEFSCLNLNITTPAGTKQGNDLPVMVYIHGGGGFSGSNGDWWCDGGSIVKRSIEIGNPS
jgi:acetyl esterase/lipase